MGKAVKIAISLPADVLAAAEEARLEQGETRSEFFRHAVEAWLKQKRERELRLQREREWDEQYERSYRECPETDEERAIVEAALRLAPDLGPWQ